MRPPTAPLMSFALIAAAATFASGTAVLAQEDTLSQREVAAQSPATGESVVRAFDSAWAQRDEISNEELERLAKAAVEGLDVSKLSGVELGRILTFPTMLRTSGLDAEVRGALDKFIDAKGADGATAKIQTLSARLRQTSSPEEQAEMIREAINHPGLKQALEAGAVRHLFMRFQGASPEAFRLVGDDLFKLERFLTKANARHLALSFGDYDDMLQTADPEDARKADRERIREKLVTLGNHAAEVEPNKFFAKHMRSHASFLGLIGGQAPELTVAWSSDPSIKSLAALEGRVVVVDFWATWCGPCIGSFPEVRKLVEHYEGYPVTIVGATSLQGYHITPDREKIDTKEDPAKEFALMADYIPAQNITWPVIFTEQEVFNPDFGVRGIPHVTIIDPTGKVRYNGLHPALPAGRSLADKAQKIDALLKEAGLPTPPAPVEEQAGAEATAPDR